MKVSIFFNTPRLGGAERSMGHQISLMPEFFEVTIFVPFFESEQEATTLKIFLQNCSKHFSKKVLIHFFPYPDALYHVSRFGDLRKISEVLIGFQELQLELGKLNLEQYDILWCNGNKIAFPVLHFLDRRKWKKKFVWHFRDYPEQSGLFKLIWKVFKRTQQNLHLVGNSNSVCLALQELQSKRPIHRLYNPLGENLKFRAWQNKKEYTLGFVSMLAPWKGLHLALQYCDEQWESLNKLGFSKIKIFGASIYHTKGAHTDYIKVIEKFVHRLRPYFQIEFEEHAGPQQIFEQIDVLFHSAIRPEPFGRVIMEAHWSGVPTITFGLGGAKELVVDSKMILHKYHSLELVQCLEKLVSDCIATENLQQLNRGRALEIEGLAAKDMKFLLQKLNLP